MSNIQEYYQSLKDSGDLDEVFPKNKGSWEADKVLFTQYYNENIKFIEDFEKGSKIDFDLDLDIEEEDDDFNF